MKRLYTFTQGNPFLTSLSASSWFQSLYPINTVASTMQRANASFAPQSLFSFSHFLSNIPGKANEIQIRTRAARFKSC